MVEVVSRQRLRKIDRERWQTFGEKALKAIGKDGHNATIAFVSDRQIEELNKRFRGLDKPTDVLSFPAGEDQFAGAANAGPPRGQPAWGAKTDLGDIAISVERAEIQARENGLPLETEISQLILHGLLHLCGYDHESDGGEMDRLELQLRRKLGI